MKKLPKIAVVGSGPVGSIIAIKLLTSLANKVEVHVIDAALDEVKLDLPSYSPSGLVNARTIPHEFFRKIEAGIEGRSHLNLIGGYSNVWGATWQSPSRYSPSLLDAYSELMPILERVNGKIGNFRFSTITKEGNSICDCMSSYLEAECKEDSRLLHRSSLLLNEFQLDSDDSRSVNVSFTPWNAKTALNYLNSISNFVFKSNTWVERFTDTANGVVLHTSQGLMEFDSAVFACGPIETSKLLLRSLPNLSQVQLLDTQMTYSMVIRWPSRNTQKKSGLCHITSDIKVEGENTIELHTQYYAHLYSNRSIVLERIPRFLRAPTTLFLRIFDPFLVVAINYLSSSASGTVVIERYENIQNRVKISRNVARNHRKIFVETYKILSFKMKRIGLFTTRWFLYHQAPGKSFHEGASTSNIANNVGKVIGSSNSYIAGAICLTDVHPGPITTAAMSHGIMVANQIIKELE